MLFLPGDNGINNVGHFRPFFYEIFSIYQIEKEDYYIQTGFSTDADFQEFLNTIKKRSVKDLGVEVTSNDRILTLSTCGNNNNYRVVIHAKKVENNV